MTSSPAPQPCPFCGAPADLSQDPDNHSYGVNCTNRDECWIGTNGHATAAEALAAWNRRHAPAVATEEAAALAMVIQKAGMTRDELADGWFANIAARVRLLAHPPGAGLAEHLERELVLLERGLEGGYEGRGPADGAAVKDMPQDEPRRRLTIDMTVPCFVALHLALKARRTSLSRPASSEACGALAYSDTAGDHYCVLTRPCPQHGTRPASGEGGKT